MSWITPHGSGGSFVNTTGRLTNPRTEAQKRAGAGTSDNKAVLCFGIVITDIPAGTVDVPIGTGVPTITPSTTGTVQLSYNGGDALPVDPVPVTNYTTIAFGNDYNSIILERRDNTYFAVSGFSAAASLLTTRLVTVTSGTGANVPINPGELLHIDIVSGSGNVTIDQSGDEWDNVVGSPEIGVVLIGTHDVTRKVTFTPNASPYHFYDQYGHHQDIPLIIHRVGEYFRAKELQAGVGSWLVADDERLGIGATVLTGVQTATYTAIPGDKVQVSTSAASRTVNLPADSPIDTEVSVRLSASAATTKATITATGTGASIVGGRVPVISSVSVELFLAGDEVTLKHIGTNDWAIIDSHITPHHGEVHGSTSAGQTLTHNTSAVLSLGTGGTDNAGLNDTANNRIVIRRAGRYTINYGVGLSTGGLLTRIIINFNIGGSTNKNISAQPNTTNAVLYTFGTFTLTLAAGDLLTISATQLSSDSSSRTTGTDATQVARLIVQEIL